MKTDFAKILVTFGVSLMLISSILVVAMAGSQFREAEAAGQSILASKLNLFGSNVVEVTIMDENLKDNNDNAEEDEVTLTFDILSGGDRASDQVTIGDESNDISAEIGDSGRFVFYLTADTDVAVGDLNDAEFGADSQLVVIGEGGDISVGSDSGNGAFNGAVDGISLDEGATIEIIYGDAQLTLSYENTKADLSLDRTSVGTDGFVYLQVIDQDANNDPTGRDFLNFDETVGNLTMTFAGATNTNLGQAIVDQGSDIQETSDNSGIFEVRLPVTSVFGISPTQTPKSVKIELDDFEVYPNDIFYDADAAGIPGDDDTEESIQVDNSDGLFQDVTNPAGPRSELAVKITDNDRNLDSKVKDRIENAVAADLSSSGADDAESVKDTPVDLIESGVNTGIFVPDLVDSVFEITIGSPIPNNGILEIEDASAAKSDILVRYADLTPDNSGDVDTDIDNGESGGDISADAKIILFKGKAAANTPAVLSLGQSNIGAQDKVSLVLSDIDLNDDKGSVDSFDLSISQSSFNQGKLEATGILFNGIDIANLKLDSIIDGQEASSSNPIGDILVSFQETGKDTSIFAAEFDYSLIAASADTEDGDNTEFTWVDQLLDAPLESPARLTVDELSKKIAWQQNEYAIPFVQEDRGTVDLGSSYDGKRTRIKLLITDPAINDDSSSVETITFSILDDSGSNDLAATGLPDLSIRLVGANNRILLSPENGEITDCGGLSQNQTFTETGANTGVFDRTFDFLAVANDCAIDPEDLANSRLVADYDDETASTVIKGYTGILTSSSKTINSGQEVILTVVDPDQNHDRDVKEQVLVEIEPDGLTTTTELLDETDLNTGTFSKKLRVGEDFQVLDGDELVDDVTVRYTDPVTSNGGTAVEKELVLNTPSSNAQLTADPEEGIGPGTKITLTLLDVDLNDDPNAEDIIDFDVLKIRTDNNEVSGKQISLGDNGLELEETDNNSGEFVLTITLVPITPDQKHDDIAFSFLASGDELDIPAEPGDLISISYEDENHDKKGQDIVNLLLKVKSYDPVISTDKQAYMPGDTMIVTIGDPDANRDPDVIDTIEDLRVFSTSDSVGENFDATETGPNTGVFTVQVPIVEDFETDTVNAQVGDTVTIEYTDEFPSDYDPDDEDDKEFSYTVIIGSIPEGGTSASTSPTSPQIKDIAGTTLTSVGAGEQVVLTTTINNNLVIDRPFVAIMEVRDTFGITVFLAWQSGILNPEGESEVGLSFTPPEPGRFMVRTFVMSDITKPEVLSAVEQSELTVN